MMRRLTGLAIAVCLAGGFVTVCGLAAPAFACGPSASLVYAQTECVYDGDAVLASSNSGDGHHYSVTIMCTLEGQEGVCYNPATCVSDGTAGHQFNLFQDGVRVGSVCLTPGQAAALGALTPELVLREFRRLRWPSAELTLQPPDGRTLVNLPTVFSTGLIEPQSQTVTLVGLAVRIEATPVAYTWQGGDGSSWATADPGAAYTAGADVDALNTHTYLAVARVTPSVDVRYHGRYQVAGGAWTDIPEELSVTGAGRPLAVLEATGLLTGG